MQENDDPVLNSPLNHSYVSLEQVSEQGRSLKNPNHPTMQDNVSLFQLQSDPFAKAAQIYGRNVTALEGDIDIILKWIQTQRHLPEVMERRAIRNFLLINKCSIEKTKQKIDMYYTIRNTIPEIYSKVNPKHKYLKDFMDIVYCAVIPQPTSEGCRVFMFKFYQLSKLNTVDFLSGAALSVAVQEVRLLEDHMLGDIIVFDLEGISIDFMMRMTPTIAAKILATYEKVYSIRIKAIYWINSPSYVNTALSICKTFLKPKIFQRIHACSDHKVLHEAFPKHMIPKDYGGEGPSLAELTENLRKKLKQCQRRFDELDALKVNEHLRPEALKNHDILGFHGNFKKLAVD